MLSYPKGDTLVLGDRVVEIGHLPHQLHCVVPAFFERAGNQVIAGVGLQGLTGGALFSFGGTVAGLSDKGVGNLAAALANARELTAEVVERLRGQKREVA
jgi:hypothetical protein